MSYKINPVNKNILISITKDSKGGTSIEAGDRSIKEIDNDFIHIIKSGNLTKKILKQFITEKIKAINNIDDL